MASRSKDCALLPMRGKRAERIQAQCEQTMYEPLGHGGSPVAARGVRQRLGPRIKRGDGQLRGGQAAHGRESVEKGAMSGARVAPEVTSVVDVCCGPAPHNSGERGEIHGRGFGEQ